MPEQPKTLQQVIRYYSDPETCIQAVAAARWPNGVTCPACEGKDHYYLKTRRIWKCKECSRQFSVKLGTIFEDSPIGLDKWLTAMWLLASCKNGISSYEVGRALGVMQRTAWFMMHRIRTAVQESSLVKLGGGGNPVEVDETFIGGKARNMHLDVKKRRVTGTGGHDKTAVMGILERGGYVRAQVVPSRKRGVLQAEVKKHVQAGAALYSDALASYDGLAAEYAHKVVDHAERYVDGQVHTNADRFSMMLSQIAGKRLTYKEVTGKVGETAF